MVTLIYAMHLDPILGMQEVTVGCALAREERVNSGSKGDLEKPYAFFHDINKVEVLPSLSFPL